MKSLSTLLCLSALACVIGVNHASAQVPQLQPPAEVAAAAQPAPEKPNQYVSKKGIPFDPSAMPSILFTYQEHQAIVDARNSRGLVRPVEDWELDAEPEDDVPLPPPPPPETRYIRLGGILYSSKNDWTIWLNEKRVTPDSLPPEIVDVKVSNEYVEMKWFDEYTKQILPIRLRSNQRFHIDARIFLPG